MANARRGLYIRVGYSVFRDGIPEDLASVTALTVIFRHICQPNSSVMYTAEKLSTYANTVSATITDADQVKLASGDYKIEVYYRRANPANESGYEPYVIDAPVFTLTDTSTEVNATACGDITIQTINLAGEVSFCSEELEALILESKQAITDAEAATQAAIDAASAAMAVVDSKIDLDGLNSNIRQLKFNTATPVAPTQAGQLAWSDEEGTLALHNGLHTHPIGMKTFFKAKNNSGALIANGKAVYAIGSTGANATIGLATTANGDIAQRTIGIATMDIASNGFGDITTFGEVNGINTSGLTEGALVYLGLNGNLTSVEPVAPTPKISLGLCIRSHLTQGRIAVYVRPIARLNKLTDVYAPNLLDGDVLRWNGTALRYEVYNLVNKADLVGGKVPASQLPAYVDDIIEYANLAAFPAVGDTGKLYVTLDTNLTYRWSGSAYTEVSKSLAIGITSTTAFRGDWGKIAYDHSQLTNSNPHGTTAAQIANTPAGTISATTVQAAINELDVDRVQLETDLNTLNTKYIDHLIPLFTNLMDGVSVTTGYYIKAPNTPTVLAGAGYTDYIPVVPGKQYRHYGFQYSDKGVYYDANKVRLYNIVGSNLLEEKIYTTPANVYFVRLNIRTSDSGMYLIENNDSALKYYLDWLRLNPNDPILPEIIGGQLTEWSNLLDNIGIYKIGYYLTLGGGEVSNSSFSITNEIDVIGGEKYRRLNQSFAYDGAFYDVNDNFIAGITGQDLLEGANVELTAPSNAKYVKLNVPNTQNISAVFCSEEDYYKVNKYNLPWLYMPPVTIEQGAPAEKTYIGTRDINTFVGSTNHVIDLLITAKPTAKFIFITHFTEDGGESNRGLKTLIEVQIKVAKYWGVKCIDLAHLVRATKKDNLTNTLIIFAPDELHPGVRHDFWSVNEIANHIYSEIKDLYPSWTNKKIAWYGTSIPAGHDLYTAESQYPKILATLLGCVTDNYSQSGGSIRRAKSDGTLLPYSFLDVNNTANYQTKMLDLIGTANEPDIFVFDYGVNDWHHDSSDFENVDY